MANFNLYNTYLWGNVADIKKIKCWKFFQAVAIFFQVWFVNPVSSQQQTIGHTDRQTHRQIYACTDTLTDSQVGRYSVNLETYKFLLLKFSRDCVHLLHRVIGFSFYSIQCFFFDCIYCVQFQFQWLGLVSQLFKKKLTTEIYYFLQAHLSLLL